MSHIETLRKEVYEFGSPYEPDNIIQVYAELNPKIGREKQHLIEEKIDAFFDEVKKIILDGADHTP